MLSPAAKQLIKEISHRQGWQELLAAIKESYPRRYKASTSEPEDSKLNKMIYHSGRQDENDRVLNLLTGETHE